MSWCFRQTESHVVWAKEKKGIRQEYQQPVKGRKDRGMFARLPNIFFTHAVTKSCMRVSSVTTSKAEGKQKLRATLDSVWQRETQNHRVCLWSWRKVRTNTNLQKYITWRFNKVVVYFRFIYFDRGRLKGQPIFLYVFLYKMQPINADQQQHT